MWRNGLRRHGFCLQGCLVFVLVLCIASFCCADDAMVLPKGRWMTSLGLEYYPGWDKQFNQNGDEEALAHDYNRDLNGTVFPMLGSSALTLGRSIVDFEKTATITNIMVSHGLSDKMTLGIKIPYWTFKTKVTSTLDTSAANMGKNPGYTLAAFNPADPTTYPLVPLIVPGSVALTADEVKSLLTNGLDVNGDTSVDVPGYQYKPFETWSDSDLGDIELGLKYQYLKNEKWQLAWQGGLRFPTGQVDDPDNLVDYGFGGGNYDIVIGAQNDYLGFKDFVLNGTLRYTMQLPDEEDMRVPYAVDLPLVPISRKEKVDRDLGDIIEVELSGNYKFHRDFGLNATYGGYFKESDRVKGAGGHYASLEGETNQVGHTLTLGVSYNTLARYQETQAGIPYLVSLSHWQRFAGENLNKAQYVSLKAALFF